MDILLSRHLSCSLSVLKPVGAVVSVGVESQKHRRRIRCGPQGSGAVPSWFASWGFLFSTEPHDVRFRLPGAQEAEWSVFTHGLVVQWVTLASRSYIRPVMVPRGATRFLWW